MTITRFNERPSADRVSTARRYLMCPPRYFDVTYRINPWMHPENAVDPQRAMDQWQAVRQAFEEAGHVVDIIDPVTNLPDMVFAANGAFVVEGQAVTARFRFPQRTAEAGAYEKWLAEAGVRTLGPTLAVNEGEGDLLLAANVILAGLGFRTDRAAHAEIAALLDRPVISLELVDDRYYHLDTAMAVLNETDIMYFPQAFSAKSQQDLRDLFPDSVLATERDAAAFGLNAVSDGLNVFMPQGAHDLEFELREMGFRPVPLDVSELLKAGGGVKCCTLEVRS